LEGKKMKMHCGCKYTIKKGIAYYKCCKWHKEAPLSVGGLPVVVVIVKYEVKVKQNLEGLR
jgi:PII-like signaling protein